MRYFNLFLKNMRSTGRSVSNPSEIRDFKQAIAEYFNSGYLPDDPKRIVETDNLDVIARDLDPLLETQHKQGFLTPELTEEIGIIYDDIREARSPMQKQMDEDYDFNQYGGVDVDLVQDIPNEMFRNNLINTFGEAEVKAAVAIKKKGGLSGGGFGLKESDTFEDELVWLLEGRNHPEHPMLYVKEDGASSKYLGPKSTPPSTGGGVTNIGVQNNDAAMNRLKEMVEQHKDNPFLLGPFRDAVASGDKFGIFNDEQRKAAISYIDSVLQPQLYKAPEETLLDKEIKRREGIENVDQSLDNITGDLGKINKMKSERNKILSDAVEEIDTQKTDDYMTDKFIEDTISKYERDTKIGDAVSMEIAEAKMAMEKAVAEGRMEEAEVIANELRRMSQKLEDGMYEDNIPTDMANILGKPEMEKGGRVGLDSGGNPLDKMKMGRRGFLGLMGSGLAALATGGKGLFTKSATTAAATAPAMTASGMPAWFPLLVDKIRTNGTARPATYAEVKGGEPNIVVYELKDPDISIEPIRLEENVDTGMIEISGRGNESQLVTMTYYAPETAINARTGQLSGQKEGTFVVDEMTKHPEQGWIETGAEDYGSLKGGVENWEAAVKTGAQKTEERVADFITNQRGKPEPFDPEGTFAKGGMVGLGTKFKEKQSWL